MNSDERRRARRERRALARAKGRLTEGPDELFERAISLDALVEASRMCESGVGWKRSVQGFCLNRVANCATLHRRLAAGTYKPGKGMRFTVNERGKVRDIRAVPFADRVVQRSLCDNALLPLVRPHLIYDNGASLKGKGTTFALDRLEHHLREHVRAHGTDGWILLFDFSKYFESIDVPMLLGKLVRLLGEGRLFEVTRLFLESEERGLGLGNQTSQLAAILYPNGIDHWAKDCLGIKGYGRYMDDGYALFADKGEMARFAAEFRELCEIECIVLNPRKFRMMRLTDPFVFLKTRFQVTADGRVVRRVCADGIKREKRKLRKMTGLARRGAIPFSAIGTSYASWRGTLLRGDASRFLQMRMDEYFVHVCGSGWRECVEGRSP